MTFTFDVSLATDRDKARVLCGDIDADRVGLQDETYDSVLGEWPNVWLAAAEIRDLLLAKWQARQGLQDIREIGDSRQEFDLRHGPTEWQKATARIRRRGQQTNGTPSLIVTGVAELAVQDGYPTEIEDYYSFYYGRF